MIEYSLQAIEDFCNCLEKKDKIKCMELYKDMIEKTKALTEQFESFSKACAEQSEMCKYWDGVVVLKSMLHNLIAADGEGDWEGHLQAVQDLLPVFHESDCTNYSRYATWYIEKMRKLKHELIRGNTQNT